MTSTTHLLLIFTAALATPALGCSGRHSSKPAVSADAAPPPAGSADAPRADATAPRARVELPISSDLVLSAAARDAIQAVGNAKAFGGWAVGIAGQPIPEVVALRTLIKEPRAAEALGIILEHGTLPGQLMALSGLYFVDSAAFAKRAETYASMEAPVLVLYGGCGGADDGERVPVKTVMRAPGAMQYTGPDDTMEGWAKRNPGPPRPVVFDILGGAYPHELRGRPRG